jgi:superfamily II DNA helicase RecQ
MKSTFGGSYAIFIDPIHVVNDEVQSASQWIHDFRLESAKFGILKREFPPTPMMPIISVLWIYNRRLFHFVFNCANLFSEVVEKAKCH